jgi:hypothetical protein
MVNAIATLTMFLFSGGGEVEPGIITLLNIFTIMLVV